MPPDSLMVPEWTTLPKKEVVNVGETTNASKKTSESEVLALC